MRILLASGNRKKAAEIAAILGRDLGKRLGVLTLAEVPGLELPEETGTTFLENARLKARAGAAASGLPTLGEDSGLCVDALDGAPGLFSARYAEGGDQARWEKLLEAMREIPEGRRSARYVCAAVLAHPDGREESAEGTCEGHIALAPHGSGGFGYDPVFQLADGRTMADLDPAEKEELSHRGKALRALAPKFRALVAKTAS